MKISIMVTMFLSPMPLPISSSFLSMLTEGFRPGKGDHEALRQHTIHSTRRAYIIFAVWCVMLAVIGVCYHLGLFGKPVLFLISVFFYVCDLICVLVWCPFRLTMGNRCCTTCRIFNWDHLMMFSPLIFMGGFYAVTLVIPAALAWLIWEVTVLMYPERFWDRTNAALRCASCTDKLCTQFCP